MVVDQGMNNIFGTITDAVEELPEYASVVATGTDSTDGGRTRVVYENLPSVNKDIEAARERGLISE